MGEHRTETRKLLIISGVTDLVLGVLKILAGIFSNSYALLIDGIHSLSDLATDVMVWIFNDIGSTKPDDDHPYGHAKFETFGTLILGLILLIVAIFIVQDTVTRLFTLEQYETPTWPGLLVALISIAGKEWLYQITARLGKKTNSRLLQANAWHHRTDALSSILVFIGIGAAQDFSFYLESVKEDPPENIAFDNWHRWPCISYIYSFILVIVASLFFFRKIL